MKVNIINISKNPLPEYKTQGSSGMDLYANIETPYVLHPLEKVLVPTGIFVSLPNGYEAQVRPRSGLAAKEGIIVINSPGTIDSDYRGEIKVILGKVTKGDFVINPGERIAQLVIQKVEQIEWNEVMFLDDTNRGDGGFGSTGKS